jgi:hypothetical protein
MAWYDYLGEIGQGIEQAAKTGLTAVTERQKEQDALAAEELSRIDPTQPLTPEQIRRYSRLVGPGSITKGEDGQWRLREKPEQQFARESAIENLAKQTARRNIQKLVQSGDWQKLSLDEKKRRALTEAGLSAETPGLFNAEELKSLLKEDPVTQAKLLIQGEEYAARLKEAQEKYKNEQTDKVAQMAAQLLRSAVVSTPEEARQMAMQLMQTQMGPMGVQTYNPRTGRLE